MDNTKKSSDARIKANRKYMEKTYKALQVQIKPNDYYIINEHCKSKNISKAKFIVNSCKYCIDNNIDIE